MADLTMQETPTGCELVNCEQTLMAEIGNPHCKRRAIAQTYRLAALSSEAAGIDWGRVNGAIMERWSVSGLLWIKKQANSGACFDD